jgi:RNA polymerase subunit RPABC4/transcription elongation factor Spt4
VVLVVLLSGAALVLLPPAAPAAAFPSSHASAAHASAAKVATAALTPAAGPTHSDLTVTSGEIYTIAPGAPTVRPLPYYQGGNITVDAGGTLIVQDVNLSFVQFIGSNGTLEQRVSHIFQFTNLGTVDFENSTLTTDAQQLSAFVKLDLVNRGSFNVWNSSFQFPGWIDNTGAGATLVLNNSVIQANPEIPTLAEPLAILGDTAYAASLYSSAGAHLYLLNSTLNDTYADNTLLYGSPSPAPLHASGLTLPADASNLLSTPTDNANLTLDYLYYQYGTGAGYGVAGGYLIADYNNSGAEANYTATVEFEEVTYVVPGVLHFQASTTGGVITLNLPSALITAINTAGMFGYLSQTCSFGASPGCGILLNFTGTGAVSVSNAAVQLEGAAQYNMYANDSTVVAIDSSIDLTWNPPPSSSYSKSPPFPWNSNLFYFVNGSTGYFLNDSVPSPYAVFDQSAFVPDATSVVNFYRWAQFNVYNLTLVDGKLLPENISGASAAAFYAYNSNQYSNTTANTLNNLGGLGLAPLVGYINFFDSQHGISKYGVSNSTGQALLLLAASQIDTDVTLPGGYYLGDYNVGFTVPYVAGTTWFRTSVTPYPQGIALGTAGHNRADWRTVEVPLPPPKVTLSDLAVVGVPSGGQLNLNNIYATTGIVTLNGPGTANIIIYATPAGSVVGGSSTVPVASQNGVANGSFDITWNSITGVLSAGTTYQVTASASYTTYETATDNNVPVGTYSVPSSPSAVGFLYEKFLGLPLWIWIAIAVAIVVALVAALLITRQRAAGKLVECGECGELIPEDATVCPKCGAQFETELVRCSRCSSTIPANSQFCPECGAQLLGKPGEGASDPERQAYADFTEKYRAEAKRELGENYTESAFWDWWKRQPTYVPFSQWKAQQNKGAPRAGMSAPPAASESVAPATPAKTETGADQTAAAAPAAGEAAPPLGGATPPPPPAAAGSGLKPCPNCGKEIPPEYLVCPFCGAVTQ